MSVVSLDFLLPLLLAAAFFFHIPAARWRQFAFAFCNGLFLYCCLSRPSSYILLAAFSLSGYAMALILRKEPRTAILFPYLVILIASFMYFKKYLILAPFIPAGLWNISIEAVGLSYLLFRQIHFLVDVMQQQIPQWSLWSYLNYQFNLFGFLSGPIQRYQEFHEHFDSLEPILNTRHQVLTAFARLFIGIIKVRFSLAILDHYTLVRNWFSDPHAGYGGDAFALAIPSRLHTLRQFAFVFYGYPLYLYFNFSGYCDVVISAAALVGMKMPENFDRPYLSRNAIDYWTRFHRTLGFWIRDYLFTPLYKALATRWTDFAAILVFPCYFIAFVLAGVWHGSTNNFAVFGAIHGAGVCLVKGWESLLIKIGGRKGLKSYLASTPMRVVSIALTLNFISFTMLFFPNSTHTAVAILHEFARRMMTGASRVV